MLYTLEAERKMGEMLAVTERAQGKRTDLVTSCNQVETPTLADLGLTNFSLNIIIQWCHNPLKLEPGDERGHMQYYEFGHFDSNRESLTLLGDQDMWEKLTDNLYPIPKDTLDNVMSDCVFLMLNETKIRGGGFVHKKLIEGKSVIAFCNLHSRDSEKQRHMILHEIAHCVLGHIDEGLSDEEYCKQERGANCLVDKWESDRKEYCEKQSSDLGP